MKEKIIDVHAHLDDVAFENNVEEIINNAKSAGVERIITSGIDLQSSIKCVELANTFDNVFCTVGIHPENVENFTDIDMKKIKALAKNKKVLAMGEMGLDYHYTTENKDIQKGIFLEQLRLADKLKLPVVIHCRDAAGDMVEMLKTYKHLLKHGGIMHCFSESVEVYRQIQKLGLKISVGGRLTYENSKRLIEVIKVCDKSSVMLETDCPYLSPQQKRGETNQPANIVFACQQLAEYWGISYDEAARITTQNALDLFWRNYGI